MTTLVSSVGAWIKPLGAAGCLAALAATPLHADPDWMKLKDRRPPVQAAGSKGDAKGVDPFSNTIIGFPAQGMVLQSWLPLNQFSGIQVTAADCWGYVSASGREYAILGLRRGTAFIEVTDPVNPVVVGYIAGADSLWHDSTVIGDYAYLVSDQSGNGVQVVDLRQIDNGTVTLAATRSPSGLSTVHTIVSNPASGFLYLCGTNINNGGLTAMRTTSPGSATNPTIAGAWTTRYVHEAQVVTYTTGPYAGREIAFCFTGGPYNGNNQTGLDIVDVTNKSNMFTVGSLAYPGVRFCHQGWLSDDKRYLYINDELDEQLGSVPVMTTRVIDVSNLSAPTVAATFSNGKPSVDHNLYVKGNMIFEGNYRSGLRVFDATNPLAPVEVAYFDTFPENDYANYNGVWGNYPFFPSGTIAISDIERGLFLLRMDPDTVTMTYPNGQPDTVQPTVPAEVIVQINTTGAQIDDSSVALMASIDGGPYTPRGMIPIGGARYRGTLPPATCGASIRYYIRAKTTSGTGFLSPPAAPQDNFFARAASTTTTLFSDDMETDQGWTVGDFTSGGSIDTATAGIWNRMRPQATSAQPGDDHTQTGAHRAWVTDGNAGPNDSANDVSGGKTTLMSPLLNLTGRPNARVGYWRWYSNAFGSLGTGGTQRFTVSVTNNNGASWTNAEVVGPSGGQTVGGWFYSEFRVGDFFPLSANVRVRFVAENQLAGALVEACVDDVVVMAFGCAPVCRADRDGNGLVEPADIARFVSEWLSDVQNNTFVADFNGLDGVTPSDIAEFVGVWFGALSGGC
ncbi:MAG: choice-of-anchor B family protein [Phycisphaeraceae bacterium]|nr:choice-of-anchor B family protein [Phycisphaeraceae bacterium]